MSEQSNGPNGEFRAPSLMRGVLYRIILSAATAVIVLSVVAYVYVYRSQTSRSLGELESFVSERVRTDSAIFQLAEDNLNVFASEFLRLYRSDAVVTAADFAALFEKGEDGATRMKRAYFDGVYTPDGIYRYGLSGFIGNNQPTEDSDFQRRLVLSYRLLSQLGPAWVNRFANVHVSFPENGIVLFWPEQPWGLAAKADLRMNELSVIRSMTQAENPERNPEWTGLYFDETAGEWMITYEMPVDDKGKHLINPSHDVFLTDIMDRLLSDTPKGGYNFIIGKDGYLIAHPNGPTESQRWIGQLSLDKIGIPLVTRAYDLIKRELGDGIRPLPGETNRVPVRVLLDREDDSYLVVGELSGPDWWFVSVFPVDGIAAEANRWAIAVGLVGGLLLLLIALIIYLVIRSQAERPLGQLRLAAEAIGQGRYADVAENRLELPTGTPNEIGLLATRFREMATRIRDTTGNLERIVTERTRELESANAALRELSLLDGLTDVHNRRAFDRNLQTVFAHAREGAGTFAVLLADIDFFKPYNDTYGHAEGDRVLKAVAAAIKAQIREEDRIYRIGGEEFAVIFNNNDAVSAQPMGERILDSVRLLDVSHSASRYGIVTMSAGLAQYTDRTESPEQLIKEADDKLYVSKREGRNRLTV